jgi:hypothetical protein
MVSRRRFLEISAAAAAATLLSPSLALAADKRASKECFLIGDGQRGGETLLGSAPYSSRPGAVKIFRPERGEIQEIPMPFFPHSFEANPAAPNRVVVFEKWGRHIAEIDIAALSLIRVTEAPAGRRFFGHGAHSGKYIYATQMDDGGGRGLLAVMESTSHAVVNEIETHGAFPHDCQWLSGANTLLVVNSRKSAKADAHPENFSSLAWLDAESGKCLKQQFIETRKFGYAHLAQSADGYRVLAGSYDSKQDGSQPLLAVIHPEGTVREFDMAGAVAERLLGEALSLYLDEQSARVVATLPNASRVQAWNYRTGKFMGQAIVGEPRGLAYSKVLDKLLVSSAQAKNLLTLNEALNATPFIPGGVGVGSHLYRMEL